MLKTVFSFVIMCSFVKYASCTSISGSYFSKKESPGNGTGILILKDTAAVSLIDCTRQCLRYTGCSAEGYHSTSRRCILAGDEDMSNLTVNIDVDDTVWVFYKKNADNTTVRQFDTFSANWTLL